MSYQIEFRHLKYFLAVAEELHFRKASEKLFISQPGLSKQIKQLEEDLGIKLFERNNRKVKLTKAGEFLKVEISNNLKNLDNIFSRAKLLDGGEMGTLKFGYVGSAVQELIPDLILKYSKDYPNVSFGLNEMDNNKQLLALLNQEIDLGFVRYNKIPTGLKEVISYDDTFSLVLPKEHLINEDNFKNLKQLKDESFILFDESYSVSYFEKIMSIFERSGFNPKVSHNSVNASSIFRLVENKLGVSIIPTALKKGYDMNVKFIELTNIPQRTKLKIVWNPENMNPSLIKFIEVVKKNKIKRL
jgi:DNA-binding transcriptional LysR family regulator